MTPLTVGMIPMSVNIVRFHLDYNGWSVYSRGRRWMGVRSYEGREFHIERHSRKALLQALSEVADMRTYEARLDMTLLLEDWLQVQQGSIPQGGVDALVRRTRVVIKKHGVC